LELLGEDATATHGVDLTVSDVAGMFGRKPGTVRGWCEAGLFEHAYRNRGREWRIPRAALRVFQDRQRTVKEAVSPRPSRPRRSSLSDWRSAS
jgi:hypothetical protein